MTNRKLFVNLAVRDLKQAMTFFSALGFEFNPKFTDDKGACMIVSQEAFVMLLSEPFFKTFTAKEYCETKTHAEVLCALSCESKSEVDEMVKQAIAAGGKESMKVQDHGFMYLHSFLDLDGHHWEVLWMDPKAEQLQ